MRLAWHSRGSKSFTRAYLVYVRYGDVWFFRVELLLCSKTNCGLLRAKRQKKWLSLILPLIEILYLRIGRAEGGARTRDLEVVS